MTSGGVGTVALGVSGLLAWTALRLDGEASQYCDGALCTRQEGVEASQRAVEAANYATLALGVGAATLVAGAVLYFVPSAREESEASDTANVAPFVGESRLAFDR